MSRYAFNYGALIAMVMVQVVRGGHVYQIINCLRCNTR